MVAFARVPAAGFERCEATKLLRSVQLKRTAAGAACIDVQNRNQRKDEI